MGELKYYKPTTLKEAENLLIENGSDSKILNGGTFVVSQLKLNNRFEKPTALVDIKGIKELKQITFSKEEGIYIGATMTISEIAHHKDVVENYAVLADALESVGSGQIRNRVTLVGNNCTVSPFADTTTPLLVLDAVFEVYSKGEFIDIPVNDFYRGFRKNALSHSDIVTGIKIPCYKNLEGVFTKIGRRKEFDLSTISATVAKVNGEYKIGLQTVAPTPIRAKQTEEYLKDIDLKNKNIDLEIAELAGEIAKNECSPVDDLRGSKEYRLQMVKVAVKRSLIELCDLEVK